MYTRGDGEIGYDISHLIPLINLTPFIQKIKTYTLLAVRGELIMAKDTFETKYKKDYANIRNMVCGKVNSKTLDKDILSDIDFVAYEIVDIKPPEMDRSSGMDRPSGIGRPSGMDRPTHSQQLSLLSQLGFQVVVYEISHAIDNQPFSAYLQQTYAKLKKESRYEIDGIVVTENSIGYALQPNRNPTYAFAFKQLPDGPSKKETRVIGIEWNVSKHNYFKPTIQVQEVHLSGVKVNYVTGHNAKFILDNKIGIDTILELTRSGDVIPHITRVVKGTTPVLPSGTWNDNKVELMNNEMGKDMYIKQITAFFTTIGVRGLNEKTVAKLYYAGYTSISKIIKAKVKDISGTIEGIGAKIATNIVEGIKDKLYSVPLYILLAAVPYFGIGLGIKKMKLITDQYPNIISIYKTRGDLKTIRLIADIKGYSIESASKVVKGLPKFISFCQKHNISITNDYQRYTPPSSPLNGTQSNTLDRYMINTSTQPSIQPSIQPSTHPSTTSRLQGKKVVFSGFRNPTLENEIQAKGGQVMSSVSKNTDIVIVKDPNEKTAKIQKARELGTTLMLITPFVKEYGITI